MQYFRHLLVIVTAFCLPCTLTADEVITFFVRAYPKGNAIAGNKAFTCDLQQPGKIAEYCLKEGMATTSVSGIFFSYAGFLDVTNLYGQVIFPRKQINAQLKLLITDKLTPSPILNHILDHWELEAGTPAEFYSIKREWDSEANLNYWLVEAIPLPHDNIIPLETIVMFAKPKHVYIPIGASIAHSDPNLILPDIFVRESIKKPSNALYLLNLRQFFGPIGTLNQKKDLGESLQLYNWGQEIR